MLSEKLLSSFAVLAVIVITLGYFVAIEPEHSQVTSSDRVVTVTGFSRESQPITVDTKAQVNLPQAGLSYHIAPDAVTLDEQVRIVFTLSESQALSPDLTVYRLHPDFKMWEPVNTGVSRTPKTLAIETAQLGSFSLAEAPSFAAPIFSDVYNDMRDLAPNEAVGYEVAAGFQLDDQELIRLPDIGEQGGCGGTVRVGDNEAVSRLERETNVEINGEQQALKFVFVARWFTSSTDGCDAGEPLRPLTEYDIMTTIQI